MLTAITSYQIHRANSLSLITYLSLLCASAETSNLVLIDDNSEFNSDILNLISKNNIRLEKVNWSNLSKSFNLAFKIAFEELNEDSILLFNNDILLETGSLKNFLSSKGDAKVLTGLEACGHEAFPFSAIWISREVYEKVGKFDEDIPYVANDNDYIIRLLRAGIIDNKTGIKQSKELRFHHEAGATYNAIANKADIVRLGHIRMKEKWTDSDIEMSDTIQEMCLKRNCNLIARKCQCFGEPITILYNHTM